MPSTANRLYVSVAEMRTIKHKGKEVLVLADKVEAEKHFQLLVPSYASADKSFDRTNLRFMPLGTKVFNGWDGGTLAGTTSIKRAGTLDRLDDLLEVDLDVLRKAMVDLAIETFGASPVSKLKVTFDTLSQIVGRELLEEMLWAGQMDCFKAVWQQHDEGREARIELPMGISARAATSADYKGVNQLLRLKVLEWARLTDLAGLCGLNAPENGLPASLGKLGYWIFPVKTDRAIFGDKNDQRVNWLPAARFREVHQRLARDQRARANARTAVWARDTRHYISTLGGEV